MTGSDQKQIREDRDPKGFLNPIFLTADLMLAQSQVTLHSEFSIHLLHRPAALVAKHHLSQRQFGQIGHQDFCVIRDHVTPFFTQNHGDVTDVTKTQAFAVNPKRFAPLGARQTRNPSLLVIFSRNIRHQVFDGFILYRLPRPGDGKD